MLRGKRRPGKRKLVLGNPITLKVSDELRADWDTMLSARGEEGAELLRHLIRQEISRWESKASSPPGNLRKSS